MDDDEDDGEASEEVYPRIALRTCRDCLHLEIPFRKSETFL